MTSIGWLLFALLLSAKAMLVLAAALGLTHLMRDRSAAERHLVWVVASACVLALPVLSLAGPSWHVGVPLSWVNGLSGRPDEVVITRHVAPEVEITVAPRARLESVTRALGTSALAPAAAADADRRVQPAAVSVQLEAMRVEPTAVRVVGELPRAIQVVDVAPGAIRVQAVEAVSASGPTTPSADLYRSALPLVALVLVLVVWLGGSAVVLVRIVSGFMRVRRMTRIARSLRDPALRLRAHGTAAELGVDRPLRLLEGDVATMPITFGILRPTLLLPSCAREWTRARQDAVLRHELEHIRRHDSLTQLIAELGCAFYWFNPLMWYASLRLRVEREHACDDAVLASGSRPSDYAAELLDIARTLQSQRATEVAAIAMAGTSHLRVRVSSVLDAHRRRERASTKLLIPAWIGALVLITPLSSLAPQAGGRAGPLPNARAPHAASAFQERSPAEAPVTQQKPAKRRSPTMQRVPGPMAPPSPPSAPGPRIAPPSAPPPTPWSAGAAVWPSEPPPPPPAAGDPMPAVPMPPGQPAGAAMSLGGMISDGGGQQDCLSSGRNTNVSSNTNNGRRTIKWSGSACSGEVVVEGDIEFEPGFTTITGISRGGRVQITTEEAGVERRVTITPASGGIAHDYRVDGNRREFDEAGREWLSSTLMFMFRRFGFMADERAAAILQRGGVNALLSEVDLLNSDYVRSRYLAVLIERGQLDEAALDRVLRIAGSTVDSDHYRTQIITAVAGRYDLTDGVRDAYIRAVSGMDSDHYRHQAFSTLLKNGRLTPAQVAAVLGETRRIDSDHYRAQLLNEMAAGYRSTPGIRPAYLEAAAGIDSDHYKTSVLMNLFSQDELSSADLAQVVNAAATIDSDHYRANVLAHVARSALTDAALQRAFVRAAAGIESDHYLQSVLGELANRDRLDNATLLVLLEAAEGIDSDHYRSELLIGLARRHRLEGEARTRFERLMQGIESSRRRDQVAEALRRSGP
jgi:beta-lactamase regulating signal transducer with metallopeptidase domain